MKMLIADDMPEIGKRLERLLRHMPGVSTVNYCSTADAAILYLLELQPDLLILDHQMKTTTGSEVLRKIPQYSPHTQVCIFSAFLSDIDLTSYDRREIQGFYDKKDDLEHLLSHVESQAAATMKKVHVKNVPIN